MHNDRRFGKSAVYCFLSGVVDEPCRWLGAEIFTERLAEKIRTPLINADIGAANTKFRNNILWSIAGQFSYLLSGKPEKFLEKRISTVHICCGLRVTRGGSFIKLHVLSCKRSLIVVSFLSLTIRPEWIAGRRNTRGNDFLEFLYYSFFFLF